MNRGPGVVHYSSLHLHINVQVMGSETLTEVGVRVLLLQLQENPLLPLHRKRFSVRMGLLITPICKSGLASMTTEYETKPNKKDKRPVKDTEKKDPGPKPPFGSRYWRSGTLVRTDPRSDSPPTLDSLHGRYFDPLGVVVTRYRHLKHL